MEYVHVVSLIHEWRGKMILILKMSVFFISTALEFPSNKHNDVYEKEINLL